MRFILLAALMLMSIPAFNQKYHLLGNGKGKGFALAAIAGASKGVCDALSHQPGVYGKSRFVKPDSWRNKYRNGDPAQGPAFPGATHVFVATTDLWHLSDLVRITSSLGSGVVVTRATFKQNPKPPKWHHIVDLAVMGLCHQVTFNLVYNVSRRKPLVFGWTMKF